VGPGVAAGLPAPARTASAHVEAAGRGTGGYNTAHISLLIEGRALTDGARRARGPAAARGLSERALTA
jgi:hypothetical protein